MSKKTVLITGSNGGIGKALIKKFAVENNDIIACARQSSEDLNKFYDQITRDHSVSVKPYYFNLLNENETIEKAKQIISENERIDTLINNAGVLENALFQMSSMKKIKEVFQVNFFSTISLTQIILKKILKSKAGSIINVSSSSAKEKNLGRSAYASSKTALETISIILSKELARYKIRVNVVSPGMVKTNMSKNTIETALEKLLSRTSLNRIAEPFEIADLIYFLSSEQASYINGEIINIDGGLGNE
jgi:3-oxoacyl-[acyl-carrier protein] reductase